MHLNDISVVILLYQTPKHIIKNLSNYKGLNLYILDQSNDYELKKKIKSIFPNIKYYGVSNENKGFSRGINFLVKKVNTKYFLCTQPDTIISKSSIFKLKKTLIGKKGAIISVPKIKQFKNYSQKNKDIKIIPVKKILGAIFLAERKKFIDIGMFDENFFFYWEDVDLCKRIEIKDLKILLNRNSTAYHEGEKSVKPNLKSFVIRKFYFKLGEYIYQSKYNNLRLVKVVREPFKLLILIILYSFTFQFKKSLENFCFICAIIKFLIFSKKSNKKA